MAEVETEDAKLVIRVLRALNDWSQEELAEKARFAPSSVRRWETDGGASWKSLAQLAEGAGVPAYVLEGALLPTLHFVRTIAFSNADDLTRYETLEATVAYCAEKAAEMTRGYLRSNYEQVIERARARRAAAAADAWRPIPKHRKEAEVLWECLADCTAAERDVLLNFDDEYHRWALVERIADQVIAEGQQDPMKALDLANLAFRIAAVVPGEEAWTDRVKGYAVAAQGHARRVAGLMEEAGATFTLAVDLWNRGAAMPGLLEEEGFQALLRERESATH